ncbi:MAG TPA: hypothetical protein VJM69_01300, partial [Dehalococcoidia bacterium]|nr:hypothetical protein [Dehalococcoidia bacterium]
MNDDRLAQALDDCLEELERGAPLSRALARYPDMAAELRPLLLLAQGAKKGLSKEPRRPFLAGLLIRLQSRVSGPQGRRLFQWEPTRRQRWQPGLSSDAHPTRAYGPALALAGVAAALGVLFLAWVVLGAPSQPVVRPLTPPPAQATSGPSATEELVSLIQRVEDSLGQIQNQAKQGQTVSASLVQRQKQDTQALLTDLQLRPPQEVQPLAPRVAEVAQQQQEVLAEVKDKVSPEAKSDVDETVRLAGQVRIAVGDIPTSTPTPTPTPSPS